MASTGSALTMMRANSPFSKTDLYRDTLLQLGHEDSDSLEDLPSPRPHPNPALHQVIIAARAPRPARCSRPTASVTIAGVVGLAIGATGGWFLGGAGGAVVGAVANATVLTVVLLVSRLCCARAPA